MPQTDRPVQKKNRSRELAARTERWQESHGGNHVAVMSARQYSMGLYLDSLGTRIIDIETLATLSQTTVSSMLIRGYLKQKSPTTVYWTREGSEAVRRFAGAKFDRKMSNRFSTFLSLDTYHALDRSKVA